MDLLLADLQRPDRGARTSTLELTPAARALIAREGNDPAFGARPLKRTIQRLVENPFARALLPGHVQAGRRRSPRDADPASGTLVFSAGDRTVVAEASDRRDARRGRGAASRRPPAPAAGAPFDLPAARRPEAATTAAPLVN